MTEEVPAPLMVAAPPTTVPPSGPAPAGPAPSAISAEVVKSTVRMRGDIGRPLVLAGHDQEKPPVIARPSNGLGDRKVSQVSRLPAEAVSPTNRGAIHADRCQGIRGNIMVIEASPVGEGVKLGGGYLLGANGHIAPQLAQEFKTAIRDQFGGVVGP